MLGDQTLAQLTEMFGDYIDQKRIQAVVQKCNNNLEASIEELLNGKTESQPKLQKKKMNDWFQVSDGEPKDTSTSKGAIKKITPQSVAPANSRSFASFLQKGNTNQGFGSAPQPQRSGKNVARRGDEWPANFWSVCDLINKGYRVMVLMRGAPGSGKSYLSRALIDKTIGNGDYRNHIFSADDYFMVNGVYKYQADRIDSAHAFSQSNVRTKARDGWSPIVVDNTNMKHWEMHAYVQIATDNGYYLETLEPITHWRNNARALAARNTHGVPEQKIKSMLANYEKLHSVTELYKQCKLEHVLYLPPKQRHFPIVRNDLLQNTDENQNNYQKHPNDQDSSPSIIKCEPDTAEWSTSDWEASNDKSETEEASCETVVPIDTPIPKPPRPTPKRMYTTASTSNDYTEDDSDYSQVLAVQSTEPDNGEPIWTWPTIDEACWKPYDEESVNFWSKSERTATVPDSSEKSTPSVSPSTPLPKRGGNSCNSEAMAQLLKLSEITIPDGWEPPEFKPRAKAHQTERRKPDKKKIALVKHRRGCENENTSFSEICNVYPNIPAQYLWDLFEKCNGDGDWTASLLLEEQKNYDFIGENNTASEIAMENQNEPSFECDCNEPVASKVHSSEVPSSCGGGYDTDRSTVSSGSPRNTLRKKNKNTKEFVKKQLEQSVVLGTEHYSDHIQQIRVAKGIISKEEIIPNCVEDSNSVKEDESPEVIEVSLGVNLVKQLHAVFKDKHGYKPFSVDEITEEWTKVFLATDMAEQLYLSFMDSVHSHREMERLSTMKKDIQIARQIEMREKYPALFKESSDPDAPNLNDIIEMEYALSAYRNEMNGWTTQIPQDIASQMTRQKLAELFPYVEENLLYEILHAHDNKFHDTVNVLNNSIPEQLRKQIAKEQEALLKRTEAEKLKAFTLPPVEQPNLGGVSREDAINNHLRVAEENRNLAMHHLELKNACHQKSQSAIQRGMVGVAGYYAQIAQLHWTKIHMYNNNASSAIMEVHKLTLNNSDVLDLHFLHSEEALQCMEIFLAQHAENLKRSERQYKELFIVTGRGLHSTDGIPVIKHKVKAMLKDLGLRCVEVNPGYLKIKLHTNSDMQNRLMLFQSGRITES
ncbi:NEDD4-binding protein 2 [Toxorhynchites rutilus septentrionalis]|uniref:NEDD4-binding protein 2 n=1 Tax=Toxorhynchites rutilus septentrionalis TaxID=329112 RepID=UPI00247B09F3|nr:NEDD4-binding protein 2 [Toxorhynchites rutilus septentrionalis]